MKEVNELKKENLRWLLPSWKKVLCGSKSQLKKMKSNV